MTPQQQHYRKQLLRIIHRHPHYLSTKAADAWSEWLHLRYGIESSVDLSIGELRHVLDILEGNAQDGESFKPDHKGRALVKAWRHASTPTPKPKNPCSPKQASRILQLWQENARDTSHPAMMRFIERTTGTLYIDVVYLSRQQASDVIVAIGKL